MVFARTKTISVAIEIPLPGTKTTVVCGRGTIENEASEPVLVVKINDPDGSSGNPVLTLPASFLEQASDGSAHDCEFLIRLARDG